MHEVAVPQTPVSGSSQYIPQVISQLCVCLNCSVRCNLTDTKVWPSIALHTSGKQCCCLRNNKINSADIFVIQIRNPGKGENIMSLNGSPLGQLRYMHFLIWCAEFQLDIIFCSSTRATISASDPTISLELPEGGYLNLTKETNLVHHHIHHISLSEEPLILQLLSGRDGRRNERARSQEGRRTAKYPCNSDVIIRRMLITPIAATYQVLMCKFSYGTLGRNLQLWSYILLDLHIYLYEMFSLYNI